MAHLRINQVCRLGMAQIQRSIINNSAIGLSKPTLAGTVQIRYRYSPKNPGLVHPREGIEETDEEFDARYINFFKRPDIDGWELRKGINDMHSFDLVPEPQIIIEVIKACRRLNDHSLAVRYLEGVWRKANYKKHIIDYLMQEIKPTLDELGVSTPEEMGYDEPELALGDANRSCLVEVPLKPQITTHKL